MSAAGAELKVAPDFATETYPAKGQLLKMVHVICKNAALLNNPDLKFLNYDHANVLGDANLRFL